MKVEIQLFQFVTWTLIWEPLTVSYHLPKFGALRSSADGNKMHVLCHVTSQDHVIKRPHNFMGGNFMSAVCHHPDKFGDRRHCNRGDWTCDLAWDLSYDLMRPHLIVCLKDYMILWVEARTVHLHLAMFGGHWSAASADITYLVRHETSQDHAIEG